MRLEEGGLDLFSAFTYFHDLLKFHTFDLLSFKDKPPHLNSEKKNVMLGLIATRKSLSLFISQVLISCKLLECILYPDTFCMRKCASAKCWFSVHLGKI